jgi:(2S)-methylsuccinyl-CoA dehydrogenase
MFLAEKTPGNNDDFFPDTALTGGEIQVIGYRGMKEFELAFDEFYVPKENLLGEKEGFGFNQLMQTFESARIQTASRAIGITQSACELAIKYANDRHQFGKKIIKFPRVYNKLAMMVVELMVSRQLTYYAAEQKDNNKRCDLEAGMAKLLSSRVAWSAADNSLQIHGSYGYALEHPASRLLCDARIINIFEGTAEIQANVISRRILSNSINEKNIS